MAKFALVAPVPPPRQAPVGHKLQAPKLVYTNSQFWGVGVARFVELVEYISAHLQ